MHILNAFVHLHWKDLTMFHKNHNKSPVKNSSTTRIILECIWFVIQQSGLYIVHWNVHATNTIELENKSSIRVKQNNDQEHRRNRYTYES